MLWVERTHPVCLARMITHRYPIHSALQAYAERPRNSIKRIVLLD